jgi:hypothetical protein
MEIIIIYEVLLNKNRMISILCHIVYMNRLIVGQRLGQSKQAVYSRMVVVCATTNLSELIYCAVKGC